MFLRVDPIKVIVVDDHDANTRTNLASRRHSMVDLLFRAAVVIKFKYRHALTPLDSC